MIYNSINTLKYLDRLGLLEDEFKELYDSEDGINFFCDYRVSSLEKEKEQFLEEIMILGVKDETIKEKLKKLLEI